MPTNRVPATVEPTISVVLHPEKRIATQARKAASKGKVVETADTQHTPPFGRFRSDLTCGDNSYRGIKHRQTTLIRQKMQRK